MTRYLGVLLLSLITTAARLAALEPNPPLTTATSVAPPAGLVRLEGHSFHDDRGPFLGLGVSYFQALRHAHTDRPRLESNLAFLAARGFNYLRVLSMVAWDGLEIAPVTFTNRVGRVIPGWPDYPAQLIQLLDTASRHGLRVELTLFADAQVVMPSRTQRAAHVGRVLEILAGREAQLVHLEVANEAWQNGFPGPDGLAELRDHAVFLAARTRVPVAITSNADVSPAGVTAVYRDSAADLATVHFSRDVRTFEGGWLPVRDCWWAGRLPGVPPVSSNEPVGPGSSVASESDPLKLAAAAVFAYLAGLPAYVFHSSAGVYAHEPFETTPGVDAFRHLHRLLPGDVASWDRHDGLEPAAPFTSFCEGMPDRYWTAVPDATDGCHRHIGSRRGDRFVSFPMGLRPGGLTLEARHRLWVEAVHPLTGLTMTNRTLAARQRFWLPAGPGAYLLRGRIGGASPP